MELSAKRCGWVKARVLVVDACDYAPSVFLSHATAAVHSSSPARSASSLNFVLPGISFAADCRLGAGVSQLEGSREGARNRGGFLCGSYFLLFKARKRATAAQK